MKLTAPRIFCVGTHHKTGTLWMRAVFRRLAADLGLGHHNVFAANVDSVIPDLDRVFLFQWSSAFPDTVLSRPDARLLHVVRDPRDVLLSGMRYHRRAGADEPFLHEARDDLDGRSYQEHLNALPDDAARLLFEMGEKHAETLTQMIDWTPAPNTVEARYEDLIADRDGRVFRNHLRDLGLPEPEVEIGARHFWEQALFGGLADRRPTRIESHVTGKIGRDWRHDLPRGVAETYAERHGDALVHLGYETDATGWLEDLRDAA